MSDYVAIAHEHYYERGGGEHVAEELARTFDAPLYTGFINEEAIPSDSDVGFHGLFDDKLTSPLIRRSILYRDFYYQFAWQYLPELHDYDVIVQSGNNPGWYVPKDEQVVVKYVHSTPRTAYDLFHRRGDDFVTKLYSYASRVLYFPNTPYPDLYVANSELVARRIHRYWGIPEDDIEVVYPPVDVDEYAPRERQDYYLTYSRLAPGKRIDEIVRAFRGLDEKLVVGGSGEQEEELKRIAPSNVEFVGYMSEDEKRRRLGEAKALLFNSENEDFGLVPVEGFASGTPVLGVDDGYTKYQIVEGKNGRLHDPDAESIRESVEAFGQRGVEWSREQIREFAQQYGRDRFKREMREAVERARESAEISPDYPDIDN